MIIIIEPFGTDFQGNCDVDASSFDGNTALHLAAGYGLKGQTALLVAAGADTSLQNSDEETAFDLANVAEVSLCQFVSKVIEVTILTNIVTTEKTESANREMPVEELELRIEKRGSEIVFQHYSPVPYLHRMVALP